MQDPQKSLIIASRAFGLGLETHQNLTKADITQEIQKNRHQSLIGMGLKTGHDLLLELYAYREKKKIIEKSGIMTDEGALIRPNQTYLTEISQRFDSVWSQSNKTMPLGVYERLVMFWSNHFAVSVRKGQPLLMLAGAFEREAIRPHIYGRFQDMLLAVIKHPAMLLYLDNERSIGPNSPLGKRANRPKDKPSTKGLNENLARELLELHTLGVNGGYSQSDVIATAKLLTGWSVARPRQMPDQDTGFVFTSQAHEPGPQIVMGKSYGDQAAANDQDKLINLLNDLSLHPQTARHICQKLLEYFITDKPRLGDIDRLTKIYLKSGGDLYQLSLSLMNDPELNAQLGQKIRSPQEHLIAIARAVPGALNARSFMRALKEMGQPFWEPPGPNGFSSQRSVWVSADGMNSRLQVCHSLSRTPRLSHDARILAKTFGNALSEDTIMAINGAETRTQGLSLFMMSPEMMKR